MDLIQDAVVVLLADCAESPVDCAEHLKMMRTSPKTMAGYLMKEAKRLETRGSRIPENQGARASAMWDRLAPAEKAGLTQAMQMLSLTVQEFEAELAVT